MSEVRLIDANALISKMVNEPVKAVDGVDFDTEWFTRIADTAVQFIDMVEDAPTVDAVTVVRCKDCKHLLVINGNELYATCRKSVMQFDSFGVDTREFYCAYGEVKHE